MQQFKAFEVNFGNKIFFSLLRSNKIPRVSFDEDIIKSQPGSYVPKFYVLIDEIPYTNVNNKVDYKQLENTDIFDKDNYIINGKIIKQNNKILRKKNN